MNTVLHPLQPILLFIALIAYDERAFGQNDAKRLTDAPSVWSQPGGDLGATLGPQAGALADALAQQQGLSPVWVRQALGQARVLAAVSRAAAPAAPGTPKNWMVYRSRFVEPRRIRAGVAFWRQHQVSLRRAERETGVPAQIIAGVIGVETLYGQQMGNFRVLDALVTLGFAFPPSHPKAAQRSAYFLQELGQYLRLMHDAGVDPAQWRGSYAGAMGLPQFMPSSWRRYAVDFDGDGRIDLFHSPADAIGSVANYLQAFGWQAGLPTHYPVSVDAGQTRLSELLAPDIVPSFDVAQMQSLGVTLHGSARRHPGKLALIELQNGSHLPSYVAGTANFYAITRYNWSSYYAMAVIELGQAVAHAADPAAHSGRAEN